MNNIQTIQNTHTHLSKCQPATTETGIATYMPDRELHPFVSIENGAGNELSSRTPS